MKTRGWYLLAAVATVVTGSLVLLYFWASQPVKSDIDNTINQVPSQTQVTAVSVVTTYFAATLPLGYTVRSRAENVNGPQLLQIATVTSAKSHSQLALTIGRLPQDGLAGIADYIYRVNNQNLYSPAGNHWLPEGAKAFYGADGLEATIIWPRAPFYAIISLSGAIQQANVDQVLETFVAGWQWK